MTRAGIRVTQAGIPVRGAADYQKNMDERWPTLNFMFVGDIKKTVSISDANAIRNSNGFTTAAAIPIFEHNLGFAPAFIVKFKQDYPSWDAPVIIADEKYIYVQLMSYLASTAVVDLFLAVSSRNCLETYKNTDISLPPNVTSKPTPYGLRVLRKGSMRSKEKDDYSLNTNAKSMVLHSHGVKAVNAASSYELKIIHDLGYPPTYYIAKVEYYDDPSFLVPIYYKQLTTPLNNYIYSVGRSNASTLTIQGVQATIEGNFMYIIFKDPVDTAR